MSVAFRRESDEEHLEPKFELPIPSGPNLVTGRGLALIRERISELEAQLGRVDDPEAIKKLQRDLRYWNTRQVTAELAPLPLGDKVEFGTQVRILLNGKPKTFLIVGDDEADPAAGRLSFNAPLSRAMLGAEVGETLPFGNATDAIEIVEITVPPE
ncbi:GreA/GreB family elongation factor [Altererythrobacter sp. Root672]|uniref:GreA/GreB family elongation factor n=1 Tax=Altererythrobacter sp. Root672 TaxID=1736584 RepID=UPI0006F996CF|nr:GreA/GreB family elongation factor [Altererythrobacter sp. Root672]KRA83739.1 nucleoside diphosphate kinase [Altererythrobacter sp. Root672]